jgi:hypothetical protein
MAEGDLQSIADDLASWLPSTEDMILTTSEKGRLVHIVGNRRGLVSLARACLIAAGGPAEGDVIEVEGPCAPQTETTFMVSRLEEHSRNKTPVTSFAARLKQKAVQLGCALGGFSLLVLLISGFVFWLALIASVLFPRAEVPGF